MEACYRYTTGPETIQNSDFRIQNKSYYTILNSEL